MEWRKADVEEWAAAEQMAVEQLEMTVEKEVGECAETLGVVLGKVSES